MSSDLKADRDIVAPGVTVAIIGPASIPRAKGFVMLDTRERCRAYFGDGRCDGYFDEPKPGTVFRVAATQELTASSNWATKPSTGPLEDIAEGARLARARHAEAPTKGSVPMSLAEYERFRRWLDSNDPSALILRHSFEPPSDPRIHVSPALVNSIVACGAHISGITPIRVTLGGEPIEVRCTLVNGHSGKHEARINGGTMTWASHGAQETKREKTR